MPRTSSYIFTRRKAASHASFTLSACAKVSSSADDGENGSSSSGGGSDLPRFREDRGGAAPACGMVHIAVQLSAAEGGMRVAWLRWEGLRNCERKRGKNPRFVK
jgi:hypothetical protein